MVGHRGGVQPRRCAPWSGRGAPAGCGSILPRRGHGRLVRGGGAGPGRCGGGPCETRRHVRPVRRAHPRRVQRPSERRARPPTRDLASVHRLSCRFVVRTGSGRSLPGRPGRGSLAHRVRSRSQDLAPAGDKPRHAGAAVSVEHPTRRGTRPLARRGRSGDLAPRVHRPVTGRRPTPSSRGQRVSSADSPGPPRRPLRPVGRGDARSDRGHALRRTLRNARGSDRPTRTGGPAGHGPHVVSGGDLGEPGSPRAMAGAAAHRPYLPTGTGGWRLRPSHLPGGHRLPEVGGADPRRSGALRHVGSTGCGRATGPQPKRFGHLDRGEQVEAGLPLYPERGGDQNAAHLDGQELHLPHLALHRAAQTHRRWAALSSPLHQPGERACHPRLPVGARLSGQRRMHPSAQVGHG